MILCHAEKNRNAMANACNITNKYNSNIVQQCCKHNTIIIIIIIIIITIIKIIILIKTFIRMRERSKINPKSPSVDVNPTISKNKHKNVIKAINNSKTN